MGFSLVSARHLLCVGEWPLNPGHFWSQSEGRGGKSLSSIFLLQVCLRRFGVGYMHGLCCQVDCKLPPIFHTHIMKDWLGS